MLAIEAVATQRRRLDAELVRRGLAPSRQGARLRIEAGDVLVGGALADKPSRLVSPAEPIEIQGAPPRFVSRAGAKLDHAMTSFALDVSGFDAIDVGASTGGFTDCLLQAGAASVVALDVGHGQLHERLRGDHRVTVVERCNVRDLGPDRCTVEDREAMVGMPARIVVADLSFISLRVVAGALSVMAAPGASVIVLVKPQFEAGRQEVARGAGVITDPDIWRRVLHEVIAAFGDADLQACGVVASPVRGASGNVEFLVHLRRSPGLAEPDFSVECAVEAAISEVPPWPSLH